MKITNKPKKRALLLFIVCLTSLLTVSSTTGEELNNHLNDDPNKENHSAKTNQRFEQLKQKLFETPYIELPNYQVKRSLFGKSGNSDQNLLLSAARRTLESSTDFIESATEPKLLNANGICFIGQWKITADTPYTGLYTKGSFAPAIVRASVALSGTLQKNIRAFGLAIKLLPDDLGNQASLNAFVLHSMGGTIRKHVLDLSIDNEPPLGGLPKLSDLPTALRLRRDLEKADKEFGAEKPDVSFRPVALFAEYGQNERTVISPRWLRLRAVSEQRVDQNDFRDEMRTEHYENNTLSYHIEVAGSYYEQSTNSRKSRAQWQTIGELILTESVTSKACDINLHFQHPPLLNPK